MIVNWSSAYLFLVLTYSHNSRFSLVLKGQTTHADVAELADALDSGSSVLTDVEVQILSSALGKNKGFLVIRLEIPILLTVRVHL